MHSAPTSYSSRVAPWQWALPALAMLLIQIALYCWMAPRSFEFTDESYYFHNYLHWREFTGTLTFFGAYFEWPFRALGMNIGAMRVLTLVMVLACSAVLMHSLLRFDLREQTDGGMPAAATPFSRWYLIAPMASAMMFFGYLATLRAPSYNTLSLFTMALCTACLLRTLEQQAAGRPGRAIPLLYGILLGACFLAKASSAALMVLGHTLFFLGFARNWQWKRLLEIVGLVTAGFAANLAVLSFLFPGWIDSLREALVILSIRSGTHNDYSTGRMLLRLRWDIQVALAATWPGLVIAGVFFFAARRKLRTASPILVSFVVLALVSVAAFGLVHEKQTRLWLVGMVVASLGMYILERRGRPLRSMTRAERVDLAVMALLYYLALAFSMGSNLSTLGHSAIASTFVFCGVYVRLYRLAHLGLLPRPALAAAACVLCLPALLVQFWALTKVEADYRQLHPLIEHDIPVTVGAPATRLWVDATTAKTLSDMKALADKAGVKPGNDILDLTGDGPGFIYAVGANPLATPWMIGGYEGSDAAADHIMGTISPASLRAAWMLTSLNNPLRVNGWESMLNKRIGPATHELAGSIDIANPYAWTPDAPKIVSLQLWRPVNPAARR